MLRQCGRSYAVVSRNHLLRATRQSTTLPTQSYTCLLVATLAAWAHMVLLMPPMVRRNANRFHVISGFNLARQAVTLVTAYAGHKAADNLHSSMERQARTRLTH